MPIKHDGRAEGKSSYSFKRLFKLATDTIIAFSDKPLRIAVKLGFAISIVAFTVGVVYLVRYFMGRVSVLGYSSLIISLWFIGGVLITLIGILGLYLGKAFEKIKDRPTFIIAKSINV